MNKEGSIWMGTFHDLRRHQRERIRQSPVPSDPVVTLTGDYAILVDQRPTKAVVGEALSENSTSAAQDHSRE